MNLTPSSPDSLSGQAVPPDDELSGVLIPPGKQPQAASGNPRFGLLLIVLVAVIVLLGGLTWLMTSLYE